ncbi:MAG TPA: ATP-binding protein [Actinomycetota bacterium]|nr:ATP-binding protein [Actinomycetota bacterium]
MGERRSTVRILIADDHQEARALLRRIIESDERFTVVAEAATGPETIELIETARPDAVILDMAMPDMDGLNTIPMIAQRAPHARILALTGPEAEPHEAIVQGGARDSLAKGSGVGELLTKLAAMFPELPPVQAGLEGSQQVPRSSIDEILSLLVHEAQAPLSVIEGFSLALRGAVERGDDKAILETSQAIRRASASMRALIRSFAEVGAMESGRLTLNVRETQVVQLVRLTIDDLSTGVGSHTIVVDAADNFAADVDSVRVRQVITNLITNAVKFTPRRSEITVHVRSDHESVHISVRDQGSGIPAHRQSELFKKFSRLGATGSGTGLGLYLSRGIARAHMGDLTCESAAGRGATFTLSLPLRQEKDAARGH